MENVYLMFTSIIKRIYAGDVLNHMNGLLPSVSQLLWRCNKNHQWYATLSHVKNDNTWCPYCSKYKHERLCREIMSKYLGPPSKIRRPDFLKTLDHPTGLELDIYYPQYGFATEVQGEQHEGYIEFFNNGDPNNFTKQQERDQLKKELCDENWIVLRSNAEKVLIEVPPLKILSRKVLAHIEKRFEDLPLAPVIIVD
ncbi:hypothetical protein Glove_22g83 [Diversispora epigaea]|uniref:Treble clef zinc finger domain-containing protein n=1 Tax=Diversispora epigaea TaxID=1348612 RepID=A0A397JJM7_9GLOM|nr:hypothetical protein Glove_22g83 [Diversispora epigaea]